MDSGNDESRCLLKDAKNASTGCYVDVNTSRHRPLMFLKSLTEERLAAIRGTAQKAATLC